RLQGVRRAVDARPRARLGRVTDVGRRVADRARVGGRVNAPAAPVALIRAAHVVVVLACGAARGRRTRARPGLTAVPGGAHGPVEDRGADAHPTLAGVPAGAGVAVVARGAVRLRGAGADAVLAGVVARAGVLVVARGAVEQRSVADAGAVLAGVGGGAGVAVVARRARVGGHRAARGAVAGLRVALVGGAGDRRADAQAAAVAGVVEGAGVAVVAARAGERRHRAARRAVAGPGVARIRDAGDGGADALPAAVAGVVEGAGVAVVAARARERCHRAARCPVAGPGVALVRGARDGGVVADARVTAVDGAGVPVVAVGDRGAGRAAGDGRVVADARVAGLGSAGVLVVAVGGGGAERAAGDGCAVALPAAVADVVE